MVCALHVFSWISLVSSCTNEVKVLYFIIMMMTMRAGWKKLCRMLFVSVASLISLSTLTAIASLRFRFLLVISRVQALSPQNRHQHTFARLAPTSSHTGFMGIWESGRPCSDCWIHLHKGQKGLKRSVLAELRAYRLLTNPR